jgi:CreA protein
MKILIAFVAILLLLVLGAAGWWFLGGSEHRRVGQVSTNFRWLGPNDRIVIDAFDDPKVEGVTCHIARPARGGVSGALGVAEELSDVSIACRQTGPIVIRDPLKDGSTVFDERRSLIFKNLKVVRFYDPQRQTLVYVAYSEKVLTGSPQNSISSVPLAPWGAVPPKIIPTPVLQ